MTDQINESKQGGRESGLPDTACSTSYLQPLFDHMVQDHGLTLTESEMHDIIHICDKMNEDTKRLDWLRTADCWFEDPCDGNWTPDSWREEIDRLRNL